MCPLTCKMDRNALGTVAVPHPKHACDWCVSHLHGCKHALPYCHIATWARMGRLEDGWCLLDHPLPLDLVQCSLLSCIIHWGLRLGTPLHVGMHGGSPPLFMSLSLLCMVLQDGVLQF